MCVARKSLLMALAMGTLLFPAMPAVADWKPGDPYKMHFPQLPDPNGWDVSVMQPRIVADDWKCTETGPVTDIHGWFSVHGDNAIYVQSISVGIYSDQPATPVDYSRPKNLLWSRTFSAGEVSVVGPLSGDEGWFDPPDVFLRSDHTKYYQINTVNIADPFIQTKDAVYWLGVSVTPLQGATNEIGWKTSQDHWNDDAVYWSHGRWLDLRDPITHESFDMAFVITPEPSTA